MHRAISLVLATALTVACRADDPVQPMMDHDMAAMAALKNPSFEQSAEVQSGLAEIRRATARFHDIDKAIAAGYAVWSPDPATTACPSNSEAALTAREPDSEQAALRFDALPLPPAFL